MNQSDNPLHVDTPEQLVAYCKCHHLLLVAWRPSSDWVVKTNCLEGRDTDKSQHLMSPYFAVTPAGIVHNDYGAGGLDDGLNGRVIFRRKLWDELNTLMQDEDSDIRRCSTAPIERSFVYLDVSDFSRLATGQQILIVNSLMQIVDQPGNWNLGSYHLQASYGRELLEASICTGDGFIYVLKSKWHAALFGSRIATIIEQQRAAGRIPSFHFRVGVHVGSVNSFWDDDRQKWNYMGEGVIGGRRVLEAVGKDVDDVVFVSDAVRDACYDKDFVLSALTNRGRRSDKHGNMWRVYELNHMQLTPGTALDRRRKLRS